MLLNHVIVVNIMSTETLQIPISVFILNSTLPNKLINTLIGYHAHISLKRIRPRPISDSKSLIYIKSCKVILSSTPRIEVVVCEDGVGTKCIIDRFHDCEFDPRSDSDPVF